MHRQDFNYCLPEALIAQTPAAHREGSRLLVVGARACCHRSFGDLPDLIGEGDLLVVNDTSVIKARLEAQKDSGGRAEILVERVDGELTALCQVRVSKPLKTGRALSVGSSELQVHERVGEFYRLEFPIPVFEFLKAHGSTPLPPYITRSAGPADDERYQTIFSRTAGAVAAPTAGLHFSESLVQRVCARGASFASVTLHVGAGTFQPVRVDELEDHEMHSERYRVPQATLAAIEQTQRKGGRVIAVGTTVVRALESAASDADPPQSDWRETRLFITPGYRFRMVDALITNFHLPESTLLMLVCAFAGHRRAMDAYQTAIEEKYRFFSYGDAMFVARDGE